MSRITFGRVIGALILIGIAVMIFNGMKFRGDHIARVELAEIIYPDQPRHDMLQKLAQDDNVLAVLIWIDSPGGLAGASEEVYQDLRAISAKKPVAAMMGGVATSGGYIVALGADRIFARKTTITGSIGVVFQWMEASALANKIGVKFYTLRSGDLKAQPDPFEQPSPKTMRHVNEILKETFDWFIDLVARRRAIEKGKLIDMIGDGRLLSGQQAFDLKLVDAMGGEKEARDWLAAQHNIPPQTPIELYKPIDPEAGLWAWLFGGALARFGFALPHQVAPAAATGGLMLIHQF